MVSSSSAAWGIYLMLIPHFQKTLIVLSPRLDSLAMAGSYSVGSLTNILGYAWESMGDIWHYVLTFYCYCGSEERDFSLYCGECV